MITEITKGIKVSVEPNYTPEESQPAEGRFIFLYKITIENNSIDAVKLKARHWDITDLTEPKKETDGEGVVGIQPELEPGESHMYVSGCNLRSGIGKMKGYYVMERLVDGQLFKVEIPEFLLIAPFKLN